MFMFSSTVRSRSLVSACGITPISRRAAFGFFRHVMSGDARLPRGDRDERRHHADQRRLPGPVRSEQSEDFAFFHAERNVVDRREIAVLLDDVIDLDRDGAFGS